MNEWSNYFNKHNDIKNVAMFIDKQEDIETWYSVFDSVCFQKIYIYSASNIILELIKAHNNKQAYKSKTQSISEFIYVNNDGKCDLGIEKNIDCLLFDSGIDALYVDTLSWISPKYMLLKTNETVQVCFNIWEKYKDLSEYIYIECSGSNKTEVLDWDRKRYDKELSVVFPVYNVAGYLDKCFETVLAWKADYVEFIFVNDGSQDDSRDKILQLQKNDSRIVLVDKENGGCATARKRGQLEAKGRYVTFFDPDDFVTGCMHRELLQRAMFGSYDICYCGFNYYYESSNTFESVPDAIGMPYSDGVTDADEIHRLMMFARVAIWRGIYRKEFLDEENISFYEDLRRFDDLPFKVETFAKAKSVVAVPMYMYNYRLQRPGQDVSCCDERLYVHFDIFKHLDDFILKTKNRRLVDYLQVVKVQTHIYGIQKIEKKYLSRYSSLARQDLKKNCSFMRTAVLLNRYAGKEKLLQYALLRLHLASWIKKFRS